MTGKSFVKALHLWVQSVFINIDRNLTALFNQYYSLVTLSKSSYLYIDFAICLQYAYKLAIHKYLLHMFPSFVFIAFVLLVDTTLICLDISSFFILKKISWFTKLISNFWLAFRYSLTFIQVGLNLIE
jgi:hypothetical protein